VPLDSVQNPPGVNFGKWLTENLFIQFPVTGGNPLNHFVRHFRNSLTLLPLKTVFDQPLANKFLRQLPLRFPLLLTFTVSISVEVPRGIRGVYFVDQSDLTLVGSKFVLRVYKDEPPARGQLSTPLE